jgi:hypothetical protein
VDLRDHVGERKGLVRISHTHLQMPISDRGILRVARDKKYLELRSGSSSGIRNLASVQAARKSDIGTGPRQDEDQSCERIRRPISPPPLRKSSVPLRSSRKNLPFCIANFRGFTLTSRNSDTMLVK